MSNHMSPAVGLDGLTVDITAVSLGPVDPVAPDSPLNPLGPVAPVAPSVLTLITPFPSISTPEPIIIPPSVLVVAVLNGTVTLSTALVIVKPSPTIIPPELVLVAVTMFTVVRLLLTNSPICATVAYLVVVGVTPVSTTGNIIAPVTVFNAGRFVIALIESYTPLVQARHLQELLQMVHDRCQW